MTRIGEYLAYHVESARSGDIDPSYAMLRYICDRFELNVEQRYWLAWIYAMTYCGASTFYVYNEFPDFENVNVGRLQRWWDDRGRDEIICQTDRRWVRSSSMFVPAFESYRRWVGDATQHDHFAALTSQDTPEARYDNLYGRAKHLHSFGQFALFLYLEALHVVTPLDLCPTDLDLNKAWSCRNGLYYAYGMDEHLRDTETRTDPAVAEETAARWLELRSRLARLSIPPTVWQTETVLCAYRKYHRGKRYLGYYLDRQALEIAKMADHVRHGVNWDVLWQYREETYERDYTIEAHFDKQRLADRGLPSAWKSTVAQHTAMILSKSKEQEVEP